MLSIVDPAPYAAMQVIDEGYSLHAMTSQGWKLLQVLTESLLISADDEVAHPRDQYGSSQRDTVKRHHVVTVTKYLLGLTIDETRDQLLASTEAAMERAKLAEAAAQPLRQQLEEANKALIELKKNLDTSSRELEEAQRKYITMSADKSKLDSAMYKIKVAIGERSMTEILA